MIFILEIDVPGLPPTTNGSHGHFRAAAATRKKWREAVRMIAYMRRPPAPLTKAKLTVTRFSSVQTDYGNRVSAAKPLIDGLIDAKVIVNDTDAVLPIQEFPYEKAPKGKGFTRLRIEELL